LRNECPSPIPRHLANFADPAQGFHETAQRRVPDLDLPELEDSRRNKTLARNKIESNLVEASLDASSLAVWRNGFSRLAFTQSQSASGKVMMTFISIRHARPASVSRLSNCCSPFRIFAAERGLSALVSLRRDSIYGASVQDCLGHSERTETSSCSVPAHGNSSDGHIRAISLLVLTRISTSRNLAGIKSPLTFEHAYCSPRAPASARERLREDLRYHGNHDVNAKRESRDIRELRATLRSCRSRVREKTDRLRDRD